MAFLPYTYGPGNTTPFEYLEASALGEVEPGLALKVDKGKLAKIGASEKPVYIGMMRGTVADGDVIPVIRVFETTVFETTNSVANTSAKVGAKYTVDSTGTMITATTGGAAELVRIGDTAKDGTMYVRFVEPDAAE